MNTAIILQARLGSNRLPEKVIKPILGKPMIALQIERLLRAREVDEIILATTEHPRDDILCDIAKSLNIKHFRGSENDVLDRFYGAASFFGVNNIVRCNADCPLIDPLVIDRVVSKYKQSFPNFDYVSNILQPSYPIGMHTEIFSFNALKEAHINAIDMEEREHVTPYIYRRPSMFKLLNIASALDRSCYRLTVDYEVDLQLVDIVYQSLYPKNKVFSTEEIIVFLDAHPEVYNLNSHIKKLSTV